MIDLKQKPQSPVTIMSDAAEDGAYPHGLCLNLDTETLRKLGIGGGNLPRVGQRFQLNAIVEVVEVSKGDGNTEADYGVELQVQQMELGNDQQRAHQQIAGVYQ